MKYSERLGRNAILPFVALENADNAVPAAKALFAGGVDAMEISFQTAAATESFRAVVNEVPDMLAGAGAVLNLEETKAAVDAGARFIVLPGFSAEIICWCVENDVTVIPTCATPAEIMEANDLGIDIVKYFSPDVPGSLREMEILSGLFTRVKFIPFGGLDNQSVGAFAAAPFVTTVSGDWICSKTDLSSGNFDRITDLCQEAVKSSMGFEIAHVGINAEDGDFAMRIARGYEDAFGFKVKDGNSSTFAGSGIEVMKSMYLGKNGHLAVRTNHIGRAIAYLERKGYEIDMATAKSKNGRMTAVYLKEEIGGFAVHLLQK